MKKYISSPILYSYIIFYMILFYGKGSRSNIEIIVGIFLIAIYSLVGTKLVYWLIEFIKKQSNILKKIMLIFSLFLSTICFVLSTLYLLFFIEEII